MTIPSTSPRASTAVEREPPRVAPRAPRLSLETPRSAGVSWRSLGAWVAIASIVSIGLIGWARPQLLGFAMAAEGKPNPTAATASAEPTSISCLGRIEPSSRVIRLAAPTCPEGSRVERLLVEENETVEQGQVVAVLDTRERRQAALAEAQAKVAVAQARLAQVRAGAKPGDIAAQEAMVLRGEAAVEQSEQEFKRLDSLRQKNPAAITASELDRRKMERETAVRTLEHARSQLAAVKEVRASDVVLAQAEVTKAEAEAARAQADLEATELRSPIDGTVLKVHARSGERVGDKGVIELANVAKMVVVAEVYEADVRRLSVGQSAKIRLPSWKTEIVGVVESIGSQIGRKITLDNDPVADTDARVIEVRVALDEPTSRLTRRLTNMRVETTIATDESEPVSRDLQPPETHSPERR